MSNSKIESILQKFIDVLRINIFMSDAAGKPVLVPSAEYGWNAIAAELVKEDVLKDFVPDGDYLKYTGPLGCAVYAIPTGQKYLMLGPVFLNKKPQGDLGNLDMDEVRVLNYNGIKHILDLLREVARQTMIFMDNEFLNSLLHLTLSVAQAESGSIMLVNKTTQELTVSVYKDISDKQILNVTRKVGEGIAGLVAQQKVPLIIHETQTNNRIRHLMNNRELKCSLSLPIFDHQNEEEVVGVLNVGTYQDESRLATHTEEVLVRLSKLTTEAFGTK